MIRPLGALALILFVSCHIPEPAVPKSERRFHRRLDAVTDLKDLLPLIEKTPDAEILFEPALMRMIELACGPQARKDCDAFLDK